MSVQSQGMDAAMVSTLGYTIDVHLHVGLKTAAFDIVESVGCWRGYRLGAGEDHPRALADIRKAVRDAQRELDAYDAAIAAGRSEMTNDEWRAAVAPPMAPNRRDPTEAFDGGRLG